jgi:hypothetical protein
MPANDRPAGKLCGPPGYPSWSAWLADQMPPSDHPQRMSRAEENRELDRAAGVAAAERLAQSRVDRRHDETYRRVRADAEAREQAARPAATRPPADPRPPAVEPELDESMRLKEELEARELSAWLWVRRARVALSAEIAETEDEGDE